ncbi:hypothetical protein [Chitinophaga vietnamensis]|uniref:hypothetical protein n=1 Tax=Chitinophaga vietnamensis TaxID=2593957 RepID=UPI001177509E|nr:hypothetical protein [Chitinophaga vietnamensis]
MKNKTLLTATLAVASCIIILSRCNTSQPKQARFEFTDIQMDPFQDHRDSIPPKSVYNGPLFTLNHHYPASATPFTNTPWQQALGGKPISAANALKYVEALKAYVAPAIVKFLYQHNNWNAAAEGWYQEPWTGSRREAIWGSYLGTRFDSGTFAGLKKFMRTYVLTMYDKTAAATLGKIWGQTAERPLLEDKSNSQFTEGSVIVKFAFSTANAKDWDDMQNALTISVYDTAVAFKDPHYQLRQLSFFQMDIIVKDSATSPKTGWVFSTLVYDKNAPGKTAWDKMVPLGAQWGNDPDVNSTANPGAPLQETVINPAAPKYSTATLGWGGRISGPNDAAVIPSAVTVKGVYYKNLAASSCMSCHSSAQYLMLSNLLPGPIKGNKGDTFKVFTPGGTEWRRWFQDNAGTTPFDKLKGQVALDYDMVTAFKSIPAWEASIKGKTQQTIDEIEHYRMRPEKQYNGR